MTASWVRNRVIEGKDDHELCHYYEDFDRDGTNAEIPFGVYALGEDFMLAILVIVNLLNSFLCSFQMQMT
jgi:hypothetical protein